MCSLANLSRAQVQPAVDAPGFMRMCWLPHRAAFPQSKAFPLWRWCLKCVRAENSQALGLLGWVRVQDASECSLVFLLNWGVLNPWSCFQSGTDEFAFLLHLYRVLYLYTLQAPSVHLCISGVCITNRYNDKIRQGKQSWCNGMPGIPMRNVVFWLDQDAGVLETTIWGLRKLLITCDGTVIVFFFYFVLRTHCLCRW